MENPRFHGVCLGSRALYPKSRRRQKKTKDLLAEVPGISGTVPGIGNLGSIENSGVELALSWRDRIGDWNYNVGMNLATIKNKVLSLVQEGYSIIAGDKQQSYTMAGYPIGYSRFLPPSGR